MRRLVVAMMVAGTAQAAQAADLPDFSALRGPVGISRGVVNWQGFYAGGQAGIGSSDMNFSGATSDLASQLLWGTTIEAEGHVSDWPVLGKKSQQSHGFGGFFGYNSQWDDVVLGIEANYMHGAFGGSDSNSKSLSFTTTDGYTNGVTYQADARFKITDMGSVRARAGYAFGSFLPYAFGGISLGRANIAKSVSISGTQVNPSATPPFDNINFSLAAASSQNGRFIYGYAGGLGLDMMLWGNVFARAEWEYLKFAGPVDTSINTFRGGLGYKF
jgi:opacity protein-like surface antigen